MSRIGCASRSVALLFLAGLVCVSSILARRRLAAVPRRRRARDTRRETGLPLEWSESRNVLWKTPVPGRGWSSPVVAGGRVWLTTGGRPRRAPRCARWRSTSRPAARWSTSKCSASRSADLMNAKNSHASPTPIVDGDRVYVHFGADGTAALTTSGEIVWKTRLPYESQHGNGGSPVLVRRPAHLQLRRQRRGVRRRARQADREGPLEDAAAPAVRTRPIRRRSSFASAIAISSSASAPTAPPRTIRRPARRSGGQLRGRLFQRAAAGVRPRARLHRDRLSAAVADRGAAGRHGRRDEDARRVDAAARRAADAVAAARRRRAVRRQRRRHRHLPGREDRRRRTGMQRLGGELFGVAGVRRRPDLFSERGRAWRPSSRRERVSRLATNALDGETLASMAVSGGSIFIRTDSHLYRIAVRR